MKRLELYFNILHYSIYKVEFKLFLIFNKINPANLLLKIPAVQRRLEKMGTPDFEKWFTNFYTNKEFGFTIIHTGGMLIGMVGIFLFSLYIHSLRVIASSKFVEFNQNYIWIIIALSSLTCYLFVFKDDKYLKYFKKFEKWNKEEKRKNAWISFFSILLVFVMFCLIFIL